MGIQAAFGWGEGMGAIVQGLWGALECPEHRGSRSNLG